MTERHALGSNTISNPLASEDNSFVNKSSENAPKPVEQPEQKKKRKKNKGGRRFQLNADQSGPNAAEVAEALGGGNQDDFFIGDQADADKLY